MKCNTTETTDKKFVF